MDTSAEASSYTGLEHVERVDPSTHRAGRPREAFKDFIAWTIEREPSILRRLLADAETEAFLRYYKSLPQAGDAHAIRRYIRGLWRGETGWAVRWIADRQKQNHGVTPRVLDAGCGYGTFALLFARLGADVTAVDIRPDRLDVARWRSACMRSIAHACPVSFQRMDVAHAIDGTFDLVWVYNAISHIDPAESFLEQVREHLRPGGVLVIGDANGGSRRLLRSFGGRQDSLA